MENAIDPCIAARRRRLAASVALALGIACLSLPSLAGESDAAMGRSVFLKVAQPSCSICHTLKDAGSTGTVGPALDELRPDAQRVAAAVRNGVGVMPAYADKLTAEQIESVAAYVARATRAESAAASKAP